MKFLNSFHLKVLAILFMTIDHIGLFFNLSDGFRILGRLSLPLFAFLIYQGYVHTRSRFQYFLRLFLFGVTLEVIIYGIGILYMVIPVQRNIFLTLSFGLLSLIILDSQTLTYQSSQLGVKIYNYLFKFLLIGVLVYAAIVLQFEYSWYAIFFILSFRFYPKYYYLSFIIQVILTILYVNYDFEMVYFDSTYQLIRLEPWTIQYYAIFAWIFLLFYNNKKGYGFKYFFYFYYPIHLGILYLIDIALFH